MAGASASESLVVCTALADLRREPRHASELLSQVPHGHLVLGAERNPEGLWRRALAPDGLSGWIREWSLGSGAQAERYRTSRGRLVARPLVLVHERGGRRVLRSLPIGARVVAERETGDKALVRLANGDRGEIARAVLLPESRRWAEVAVARSRRPAGALARALRAVHSGEVACHASAFLGAPYLWGGVTAGGLDCSGLTRTVFALLGVGLPRDARDQAHALEALSVWRRGGRARPRYRRGDLLFFGDGDVTHVGLMLDDREFIHSSGEVRISRAADPARRDLALMGRLTLVVRPPYAAD